MNSSSSFDLVILGAGLAGAAAAAQAAASGRRVLVLEQERVPGTHSSGRNAAMVRANVPAPAWRDLARRGANLFATGFDGRPGLAGAFRRTGGVFAGSREWWDALPAWLRSKRCDPADHRFPFSAGLDAPFAYFSGEDGVADTAALLQSWLTTPGVVTRTGVRGVRIDVQSARFRRIQVEACGDGQKWITAGMLLLATGAWGGEILRTTGLPTPTFFPMRRHLFQTAPLDPPPDPALPYFWHESGGVYLRPESGGWLASACDETLQPPGEPKLDPSEEDRLRERLLRHLPALERFPIATRWAGLRVMSADRAPVVGLDPHVGGLVWLAGLGGHGVTCAWPAAERALALADGALPDDADRLRAPSRSGLPAGVPAL